MVKRQTLIFLLIFIFTILSTLAKDPEFVWQHQAADVRNEYVYFRYELNIGESIDSAVIHLFADSRYQIFVNGIFLGFGPARSYPVNPEYDSYIIKDYLIQGKNVVAVKALYNGIENFQVPENRPGFIAWGLIKSKNKVFDLSTPGNWICTKSRGYDQNAVRFSFATGAMEVFDSRKEPFDFKETELDVTYWSTPVVINNQNAWGELKGRSIPLLTADEYSVKNLVSSFKYNNEEDIYQFRIKTPDEKRSDYYPQRQCMAYTYIYSPVKQNVEVGLWWGEFFLNGEGPLEGKGEDPVRTNRNPRILKLNAGWNFFNFYYGAIWGAWDFYMAIPKSAGLKLSPEKKMNSDIVFMTSGPYENELNELISANKKGFTSAEELNSFFEVSWVKKHRSEKTNNPALDMVWSLSEKPVDMPDWKVTDIVIPPYEGTVLTFDMGRKTLGKIFIDFQAPENSIIDIGISEDLYNDKAWLFKRKMISAASRIVCNGAVNRFETFKPYGLRFIQVNISGHKTPVTIKRIGVVEQIYPFEKIGSFECSDPMLNSIWELGWRTLRVCAEDTYTDTPFRERGLYAGDMLPEYAITLAGSGDSRLLKRSLTVFYDKYHGNWTGKKPPNESEFPLINIISTKWYYDYTGDLDLIEYLYPGYKELINQWISSEDSDGLYYLGRQFIEWTKIDKYAKLAATHSLLAQTCKIMSEFASALKREEDQHYFEKTHSKLIQRVRVKFWDNERKLFNDGFKDGRLSGKFYPTSNAWPLLYNCADKHQTEHIIEYLEKELQDIGEESRNRRITPYSAFYALAALYQNERADIAERFIRQYWTRMILSGDDTSWENFDISGENDGGGQGTASHAWSGHPTYFLTSEVLGVNLGFHKNLDKKKIVISPQSETLTWAKGIIPHPLGPVKVSWEIEGTNLKLHYESPDKVIVEVNPKGKLAKLSLWINGIRQ